MARARDGRITEKVPLFDLYLGSCLNIAAYEQAFGDVLRLRQRDHGDHRPCITGASPARSSSYTSPDYFSIVADQFK